MEIKTKYNIGEMVWFMHQNICASMAIENILIDVKNGFIQYTFNSDGIWLFEEHVFPTKGALLKSL